MEDSHVRRKHGPAVAAAVRAEAEALRAGLDLGAAPVAALLAFDRDLKERGINPGTSADFTVATLFADALRTARAGGHAGLHAGAREGIPAARDNADGT